MQACFTLGGFMAYFQFRTINSNTGERVKAAIYLGGKYRGFTQLANDSWLEVETSQKGPFSWYAQIDNVKIDEGKSNGGKITVIYSPTP
jgi:hypothetical protein